MYGDSKITETVALLGVGGMGAAYLPATEGNNIGFILAIGAITIGISALIGQIVVRVVRRHYQLRMK